MRKYIYLVLVLMLSACTNSKENNMVISVLEDVTEQNFAIKPEPTTITKLYGFESDLWKGATFRYSRITNLIHNSKEVVSIAPEHQLLSNEIERREQVTDFQNKVASLLEQPKDSIPLNYSSIWLPLVEELKVLQKDTVPTRIYLFSDLRENTRWFSSYKASDMYLLQSNSDKVLERFLSKASEIQPSSHIQVIVVYQPQNVREDEVFVQFKSLYTSLFSKLGVAIQFTSNLNS